MLLVAIALLAAAPGTSPASPAPTTVAPAATAVPAANADSKGIPGEIPVTARSAEALQLFREGRFKALNWDCPAASLLLKQALLAEPDFALALAWLGKCDVGPDGAREIERGLQLSSSLPVTERMMIEVLAAERRGDDEQIRKLRRQLVDLAPNDWLAQFQLGVQSQYDYKSQAAILHLNRALQLNPQLAEAYNYLGFVLAQQGMTEEGIAAARKFVELKPNEPNAYDSLGEVLLLVGRLDEAEAQFRKAGEMKAEFWMAWVGVSYARFYRGDFAGGHEAMTVARKTPHAESEMRALALVDAWGYLGEGKSAEALAGIDALEQAGAEKKSSLALAWARFERAEMLLELGRLGEAQAQVQLSRQSLADAGAGDEQNRVRRSLLVLDSALGVSAQNPAQAARAAADLAEELRRAPSNNDVRSDMHHAAGEAALAARDPARAVEALSMCPDTEVPCRVRLAAAQELAGQPRAAEETRARVLTLDLRDNVHRGEDPAALYAHLKLARKPRAATH